jgi:transcriptional regulator with XRE-family HTH domain
MLNVPKRLSRPGDDAAAAQRFREEVGRRIRTAMLAAGLNHRKLAELAGIDRSIITRLINGERRANADQLLKLAEALGVHAANLVSGEETVVVSEPPASYAPQNGKARGYDVKTTEGQQVAEMVDGLQDREHRLEALRRMLNYVAELRDPSGPVAEEVGEPRGRPSR